VVGFGIILARVRLWGGGVGVLEHALHLVGCLGQARCRLRAELEKSFLVLFFKKELLAFLLR
jgi:hypothetical protein